MSRRSFLLILFMIFLGLGCGSGTPTSTPTSRLLTVIISPSSGSGSFAVMITYTWNPADQGFTITCTRPDPNGYPATDSIPITQEDADYYLTFSLTKPGSYNVDCVDSYGNSDSTAFTVTGESMETSTATKAVEFKNATITFNGDQILFDSPPLGGATAAWLQGYCWPPQDLQNNGNSYFKVGDDGTLNGKCSVDTQSDHILGELTGNYEEKNGSVTVTFKLVASHVWTPVGDEANGHTAEVVLNGSGQLVDNIASGTAAFKVTCNAHGNATCFHDTNFQDLEYTGTIPFTITFLP
jgi:hypothetical protein